VIYNTRERFDASKLYKEEKERQKTEEKKLETQGKNKIKR